jgi:hypothetical protein
MSLIFKALEKLKDPAGEPEKASPGTASYRQPFFFPKRCYRWMQQYKSWVGGAVAVAVVILYGVQHYTGYFSQPNDRPKVFKQSAVLAPPIPPSPTVPVSPVRFNGGPRPHAIALDSAQASSHTLRYLAPSGMTGTDIATPLSAPPTPLTQAGTAIEANPPSGSLALDIGLPPAADPITTAVDDLAVGPLPPISEEEGITAVAVQPLRHQSQSPPALAALGAPQAPTEAMTTPSDTLQDAPPPAWQRSGAMAQSGRQADIARLIDQIQRHMLQGDYRGADQLLSELSEIKGPEDSYVLKMRAVSQMHHKAYASAAALLEMVLARDATDIDAGLNMAIIEINTGRVMAARKRLRRLLEVYPDEPRIERLFQRLPQ